MFLNRSLQRTASTGRSRRRSRHRDAPALVRPGSRTAVTAAAFLLCAGVPVWLALDDGAYDLVVRQEAGVAVLWGLGLAVAFGVLPRVRPAPPRVALVALALLVGWTALSLVWTSSAERTVAELARTLLFAGVLAAVWYGVSPRSWLAGAAGISTAAALVPALAVLSRLAPDLPLPGASAGLELERLIYPLGYWNAVAAWSAMAAAIGLAWSAHLPDVRLRALALATVPPCGLAVYLAYSRGGFIGLAIGALVVVALARNRWTAVIHAAGAAALTGVVILVAHGQEEIAHGTGGAGGGIVGGVLLLACATCALLATRTLNWRVAAPRRAPKWLAPALGACVVAVVVAGIALGPRAAADAGDPLSPAYPATAADDPAARLVSVQGTRPELWSAGLDAFASDPLTGIGPGTFEFWWATHGDGQEYVRDAHSLYVESLAELGLPGLALVVTLLGGLLAAALRARRAAEDPRAVGATTALIAAFAVYLFAAGIDWMWESTAVTVLALAAVALAAAPRSAHRRRTGTITWARLALVAAAIAAGALEIPGVVSTERVRASQYEVGIGDPAEARRTANDAVAAEPWAATPYDQLALVELARGNPAAARADARKAVEREPDNWRHRYLLMQAQIAAHNEPGALAALRQAKRLYPALGISVADAKSAVGGDG